MEETKRKPRSRYKPKKHKNKPVSDDQKEKKYCPNCLKHGKEVYLSRTSKQFRSLENSDKIERCCPVLFCLYCKYVERIEEEIKRIPK